MSQRYIGGLIYNPPGGFSGAFDGASDYLTVPNNSAFNIGSGDFTVEGFVNFNSVSGTQALVSQFNSGGTGPGWTLYKKTTSNVLEFYGGSGTITVTGTIPLVVGVWTHFAVVRSGSTITIYVNGVAGGSGTNSSFTDETTTGLYIGSRADSIASLSVNGFLSNIRIVKGTAVYTSAFTPPVGQLQAITNTSLLTCSYSTFRDGSTNNFTITVNGNTAVSTQNPFPLTTLPNPALGNQGNGVYSMSQYQSLLSQNLWPAVDPYWRYVTLMLHGNGTNGAQNNTFLDSSTNNFTITRNGNTTQGTFSPYGSNWSNFFDGSGDYLQAADSASLSFSGDFTCEGWFFYTGTAASLVPSILTDSGTSAVSAFEINNGSTFLQLAGQVANNTINRTTFSGTVAPGVWTHIAYVRSSNVIRVYVNGVVSATTLSNSAATGRIRQVGEGRTSGLPFPGYISNFRLVGSAVYTSNFTPSTSPLTAITNTQLLTCQSNRFIDNSTNAFTITRNGDVSVQRFSPFNPTAPYAAGTDGGSGYFDGTGDYLTVANNTALQLGSSDFTIDGWVYVSASSGSLQTFIAKGTGAGNQASYDIALNGTQFVYYLSGNGSTWSIASGVSMGSVNLNSWNYVALVRSGNTFTPYINGVAGTTTTSSSALFAGTAVLSIGADDVGSSRLTGYVCGARVIKGTALTITVPTAPTTAVTNTQLLCDFTNAGIIDNAEMNNLETVGNAQISTAQSKFGGASMLFDGTGDYLLAPNRPYFDFGSGDFTIEFWMYTGNVSTRQDILDRRATATITGWMLSMSLAATGKLTFYAAGPGWPLITSSTAITANTWTHVAIVRNGSNFAMYQNGTSVGTATSSTAITDSQYALQIGNSIDNVQYNGYIDDLRITKGYARYTTSFTPQRSQWQDQ